MRMVLVLGLLLAPPALAGAASAEPSAPSVSVTSGSVRPGEPVVVHVGGAAPHRRLQVYLRVYPLVGSELVRVGSVVPGARGRARLVFRLPRLAADVYRPWVRVGRTLVGGRGLLSLAASPPRGFGALGAPGCTPPSPSSGRDIFGTAFGAELWALPFAKLGEGATVTDVVGKETKIVFKMGSRVPKVFYAVAPDGARVAPVWMTPHLGSNWDRPGVEWGAGFAFGQTGCWDIHAGTPPWFGDIWLSILS